MSISECIKYWEWCARQYWQYQRRGSWKYEWHGDTLIRYVETAPADPDFAAGLLEWLKMPESVHGFDVRGAEAANQDVLGGAEAANQDDLRHYEGATVYNRPAKLSAEWKPVSAWYEQQEGQVDERTKLKLIRVYQALQKCKEGGEGDGPYMVEKGCRYKVTFTYHWKVESLPDVPQGTSGVGYTLEQITREDETGLWSCCLVRRERVRQDVEEYTAEVTAFEARTEEQHLGVKQGESAGKQASAGGGVLVKRQVRKNDDCTSDVVNETVTERPVAGAVETVERTLRAEVTVTEDRNMASPLAKTGLKVGESVRNERTPGGRWNRRKSVTKPAPQEGPIRKTCRKSIFEHSHAETEVKGTEPAVGHAAEPGEGKTVQETVRRLDEGTYEHETETREERTVEGAVEEMRKTLRGTRKTKVNRNMAAKAGTAGLKIGEMVRNEQTDGGRWNQTVESVEPTPVGKIQESCQKTALQHVHQRTENVAEDPGTVDAAEVSGGVIHRKEVRRTDEGTFDVTEVTDAGVAATDETPGGATGRREERKEYRNALQIDVPAPQANVEISAQVRTNEHNLKDGTVVKVTHVPVKISASGGATARTVEIEAGINQTEAPQGAPAANVEIEVEVTPNEHGSMTTRKRKITHRKATRTATGGTALYSEVETSAINDTQDPNGARANGTAVTCRTNPNEHGSATTTKIVRTAIPGDSGVVTWSDTGNDYFKKVYWNQQRPLTDWNVQPIGSGDVRATADFRINEFGLFDGYWMVVRDRTQRYGDIWSKEGLETIERTESTTKAGSTLTALVSVNQVKYRYAVTRNALRAAQQVQRGKTIAGRKSHIIGHLGGGLIAYIVYKYEKQVELKTVTSQVSPAQGG